jgi:phytoene synthase
VPSAAPAELDAAGITDPALRAAYTACRDLNARHGRTYFLATRLLPRERRPAVHALYGFARHADEIVDDLDDDRPVTEKAARIDALVAERSPGAQPVRPCWPRLPTPRAATTSTPGTSPTS